MLLDGIDIGAQPGNSRFLMQIAGLHGDKDMADAGKLFLDIFAAKTQISNASLNFFQVLQDQFVVRFGHNLKLSQHT